MESYKDLLHQYGSPLYVYHLESVREAHKHLMLALPETSQLYYSLKANPHPELVRELASLGCHAEVSSEHELSIALSAGMQPNKCLYTGPGKTHYEIRFALQRGVKMFSVDSFHEASKIAAICRSLNTRASLIPRINPDKIEAGAKINMSGGASQFGMDIHCLKQFPELTSQYKEIQIEGYHIYMGTNVSSSDRLLNIFNKTIECMYHLSESYSLSPSTLFLGGGFGHPFAEKGNSPDFTPIKKPLEQHLERYFPMIKKGHPTICFESGRYLVARSGQLYSTIQDVKQSKNKHFIILDAGIHHLGGMSGLNRITPNQIQFIYLNQNTESICERTHIVGPLCTPLDSLARDLTFPDANPGDLVMVPNVGAYGLTASLLGFLSKDTPAEVVVDNGSVTHASQIKLVRQSIQAKDDLVE